MHIAINMDYGKQKLNKKRTLVSKLEFNFFHNKICKKIINWGILLVNLEKV